MVLTETFKPCYGRKIFKVKDKIVTFDFGEYRVSTPQGEIITYIATSYFLHRIDKHGAPNGNVTWIMNWVADREEGQKLFDAADEKGATEFLEEIKIKSYASEFISWALLRIKAFLTRFK
jgi:hypothetical protein